MPTTNKTIDVKKLFFNYLQVLERNWRKIATLTLLADIERYLCQDFAYFICSQGQNRIKCGKRPIYAITDIGKRSRCFDLVLIKQAKKQNEKDLVFAVIEAKYATNYQKLPKFGYTTFDNISTNLKKLSEQAASDIRGDGPLNRNFDIGITSHNNYIYANMWACFKTKADADPNLVEAEKKRFFGKIQAKARENGLSWHGKKETPHLQTVFEDKLVHLGCQQYRVTLKAGFWVVDRTLKLKAE